MQREQNKQRWLIDGSLVLGVLWKVNPSVYENRILVKSTEDKVFSEWVNKEVTFKLTSEWTQLWKHCKNRMQSLWGGNVFVVLEEK